MTTEPSTICKDGTAEGSQNVDHGQPSRRSNKNENEGGQVLVIAQR